MQYWGEDYTAAGLAAAPHGLLILEATTIGAPWGPQGREVMFDREALRAIRHDGTRPVLGYVNLTEVETLRDYWAEAGPDPLRRPWAGLATGDGDERLAAFWRPDWERILRRRVERVLAAGFDGIMLDDILHYYTLGTRLSDAAQSRYRDAPATVAAAARTVMALVVRLAAHARSRKCDALIVVNNGPFIARDAGPGAAELAARYRLSVDGILIESALGAKGGPARQVLRDDFLSAGLPVLAVEFGDDPEAAAVARRNGFALYQAPTPAFDRLGPPISTGARGE